MRVLVTGSRDWKDSDVIESDLRNLTIDNGRENLTLVSGACPTGADYIAEVIAKHLGWRIERHPADWDKYGKRAGFLRNKEMVDLGAEVCLAYIRNDSKGATMTKKLAEEAGIKIWERRFYGSKQEVKYKGSKAPLRSLPLLRVDIDYLKSKGTLPLHRTEAGYPNCSTCDGGGCPDCTDPA